MSGSETASEPVAPIISLEFAGLPGSGKSYWTEYATNQLRAAGNEVVVPRASLTRPFPLRAVGKTRYVTKAFSRQPEGSMNSLRASWASQRSPMLKLRRSVQWLDTQGRLERAANGAFLIMDEGPLQALWSIGIQGEWQPFLDSIQRTSYRKADRAVVLHLPPEAALLRLESRDEGHRRLDAMATRPERLAFLERGAELLKTLVAVWTDLHGDEAVVQVDAERSEPVAQQIRDLLSRPLKA